MTVECINLNTYITIRVHRLLKVHLKFDFGTWQVRCNLPYLFFGNDVRDLPSALYGLPCADPHFSRVGYLASWPLIGAALFAVCLFSYPAISEGRYN